MKVRINQRGVSRLRGAADPLLRRIARAVAVDARRMAPILTGALRSSIEASEPTNGRCEVRAHADYSAHVELGTQHQMAQPFLRPALYRQRAGA